MKERLANNLVVSLGLHLGVAAIFAFAALFASLENVPFGIQNFVMVDVALDGGDALTDGSVIANATQAPAQRAQTNKNSAAKPATNNLTGSENPISEAATGSSTKIEGSETGAAFGENSKAGSGAASTSGYFIGSPNGNPILAKIRTKIERAKFYPAEARGQKLSGRPKVEFEILQSGEIKNAKIISSSGSAILDNAAIETIRRAMPLPYFPEPIKLAINFDSAN